jgi:predicted pyridoxine 5'-phosphate oxidase superfamily flavin-nucleotide-binding protein
MGVITDDMRRVVDEQQLGFVATVSPDGTPNLSPKGTTAVLDDDHLVFADIHSPRTVANLRDNPAVEINVVDPLTRKGFRFKGAAQIVDAGPELATLLAFYRARGSSSEKRCIVVVKVESAAPLISPAYDDGTSEAAVVAKWRRYWLQLWDAGE